MKRVSVKYLKSLRESGVDEIEFDSSGALLFVKFLPARRQTMDAVLPEADPDLERFFDGAVADEDKEAHRRRLEGLAYGSS